MFFFLICVECFVSWVGFYFVRPVDTDDDDNAHKRLKSPAAAADDKPDVSVDETKALPTDIQDRVLILGPFHGLPAVVSIPFGKGVCGTAAIQHKTQLVRNVHEVLYHIACDSASQSEIVVPIYGHIGASSHDKDNGNALSSTLSNKRVYDQSNTSRSSPSLVAVLDIDSPIVNGFSEEDQIGLEKIATLVGESCDWLNLCWPVGKQELGGGTCARIHH